MNDKQENDLREQVFSICKKLSSMVPPINIKSKKADETLRFWLPDISWEELSRFKKEYIKQSKKTEK